MFKSNKARRNVDMYADTIMNIHSEVSSAVQREVLMMFIFKVRISSEEQGIDNIRCYFMGEGD